MRLGRLAAIAVGAACTYTFVLRPMHLRWGATQAEAWGTLPGDGLVPEADLVATRAVTVGAAPEAVWPWIAQLGQGRGGFYSYDALENLFGLDIHSAGSIVAEWQDIAVGDEVRLAPEVALKVGALDHGRSLVLSGEVPMGTVAPPYDFSWAFALRDRLDGTTRLLIRERYRYTRTWAPLLVEPVEAISFVMHQRMLRGIKERAERAERDERDERDAAAAGSGA